MRRCNHEGCFDSRFSCAQRGRQVTSRPVGIVRPRQYHNRLCIVQLRDPSSRSPFARALTASRYLAAPCRRISDRLRCVSPLPFPTAGALPPSNRAMLFRVAGENHAVVVLFATAKSRCISFVESNPASSIHSTEPSHFCCCHGWTKGFRPYRHLQTLRGAEHAVKHPRKGQTYSHVFPSLDSLNGGLHHARLAGLRDRACQDDLPP